MTIAPIVDIAPLVIVPHLGLVSIIGRNSVSTTDQSIAIITKGVQEFGIGPQLGLVSFIGRNSVSEQRHHLQRGSEV